MRWTLVVWMYEVHSTASIKQVSTKVRVYCTNSMKEPPRTPYANCSDAGAWWILRVRNDWFGSEEARCVIQHSNYTSCCPCFLRTICSIIGEVYYVLMLQLAKIVGKQGCCLQSGHIGIPCPQFLLIGFVRSSQGLRIQCHHTAYNHRTIWITTSHHLAASQDLNAVMTSSASSDQQRKWCGPASKVMTLAKLHEHSAFSFTRFRYIGEYWREKTHKTRQNRPDPIKV